MALMSAFAFEWTPFLKEAEAASNYLVRHRRRQDIWLTESAGSSVSTAAGETNSEGTPMSHSEGLLSGNVCLLTQDPVDSLSLPSDEPAYIRLEGYPSPDRTSLESSVSEMPMSVRSECSLSGHVWLLCQDPAGSRQVQDALEKSSSQESREALMRELHGHAVKAMRDPHANHVLQKCISIMAQSSLQFMISELVERDGLATAVARHRYGGRIVQQLLKTCGAAQVSRLAEILMQDITSLSCHTFGNFSVQHLLRFGTEEQRHQVAQTLASNAVAICSSAAGGGVLVAAMELVNSDDRLMLARAVLLEPGLLLRLAQHRHGHSAVLHMLQVLDSHDSMRALMDLAEDIDTLRASRYGRAVAKYLDENPVLPTAHEMLPQTTPFSAAEF